MSRSEIDKEIEDNGSEGRKLLTTFSYPRLIRRMLNGINRSSCKEGYEPFVSYEGLQQLHRFILVMAITHVSYSCLTMLLPIVKIHSWRVWEDAAHMDRRNYLAGSFVKEGNGCVHVMKTSLPLQNGGYVIYGVAHQHSGGIGSTLYGQDGRVICSSIPSYGNGNESGNESGYIVV